MNIQYELEEPFYYSWSLVYYLLGIIILMIIAFLLIKFWPFFSKYFSKFLNKTKIPNLKTKYLNRLNKLKILVEKNKINNRNAYLNLSIIIREFIEKTTGINILSLSKEEIKKLNMKELSLLMEEYYPPEFAKDINGNILDSINRTMEVIKRWN